MAERDENARSDRERETTIAETSRHEGEGEAVTPADRSVDQPAETAPRDAAEYPSEHESERATPSPDTLDPASETLSEASDAEPRTTESRTTENDAPEPAPASERRRGGGIGYLALLLSLAALVVVSYPYWPIQPIPLANDPGASLEEAAQERDRLALRVETLEASSRAVADELASTRTALAALNEMSLDRARALVELESIFNETLADVFNGAPPSAREWRLAEAEYLLRVAGHRAVMEQDFNGALSLTMAADEILQELDEPQLADVRQLIASELFNLRAAETADVSGIFLRIEALKPQIAALPARLPVYRGESPPDEDAQGEASVFDRFFSLIEFRRHDVETRKPLLAPQEAEYVEQHLLAAFDRAQLSALRRDDELFAASLAAAQAMLDTYLDVDHTAVKVMRTEIEALAAIDLSFTAPAVGDALLRLRALGGNDDSPYDDRIDDVDSEPASAPGGSDGAAVETLDAS